MKNTSGEVKRKHLFSLFSKNLELLNKDERLVIEGYKGNEIICPICFLFFNQNALAKTYLTLEDIPPKTLGGKVRLLTCKTCNNENGSDLDKHLKEHLLMNDFFSRAPNVSRKARFTIDNKWNIGGLIKHTDKGGLKLLAIEGNSHHQHYHRMFKKGDIDIRNIQMTISGDYKKSRPKIALLRIAYLWLVSEFGYGSLINNYMHVVRQQIISPDNEILKNFQAMEVNFPDELEGVNIVTKPACLKSFAVAFKTKTEHKERKHIVLLPGPTDSGLKVYENLKKLSKKDGRINFDLTQLNLDGVLTDPNRVYEYHKIWNSLTNEQI